MKIISMYLPQYHRVQENDLWWGEGFTDWTTVKAADPLYEGHYQPRIPQNNNYYNLLDKNVFLWQAELMHKYGLYGMCFYHYYFKEGRRILERPAENLLRWKDIDMPFCFSWANESWTRTWSKMSNTNSWSSKFEVRDQENDNDGMLLEQGYGMEDDWIKHFMYLLPFFEDERYIKKDGKPIFIIYKPESIPCLTKMIECWRKLSVCEGLTGIYVIGTNVENSGPMDAVLFQEPQYSLKGFDKELVVDGKCVWDRALEQYGMKNETTYYCGFPGYDDTPRRGKGGVSLTTIKPSDFQKNMKELLAKSEACGNEFVFLNAWNEWGEGMYLEPDSVYNTQYLEAIKNASGTYKEIKFDKRVVVNNDNSKRVISRYRGYWTLYDKWLSKLESNHRIEDYFLKMGYKKIAIYGIGMIGKHLINEIDEDLILYGIDQKGNELKMNFPIYYPNEKLPEVDVVVVTIVSDFYHILKNLEGIVNCPVVSIEEVVERC